MGDLERKQESGEQLIREILDDGGKTDCVSGLGCERMRYLNPANVERLSFLGS